jgi:hypothetical protein
MMARKAKSKKEKIVYLLNNRVPVGEIAKALKVSTSYVYLIRSEMQVKTQDAGIAVLAKPLGKSEPVGITTLTAQSPMPEPKPKPVQLSWWQKVVKWVKGE